MTPDSEPTRGKEKSSPPFSINALNILADAQHQLARLRTERDTFQKLVVERDGEIARLKGERNEWKRLHASLETYADSTFDKLVEEISNLQAELSALKKRDDSAALWFESWGDQLDECDSLPELARASAKAIVGHIGQNPIQKRDEWVSVKERLPEFSKIAHRRILIWDEFSAREGWFNGDKFQEWDADGIPENISGVTHWRSLPEPPKRDLTENGKG